MPGLQSHIQPLKTLYPVQEAHVEMLVNALRTHHAALDSSDTGTGKTVCAVETAKRLGIPPFVVCPKAVIPSWEREMADRGVAGVVINYEKLKVGKKFGKWVNKKWVWDIPTDMLLVFDEAHKLQNPKSQNCKMAIAARGRTVLMLSATVADDPTEMRAVGYLLGLFELKDYWEWCRTHGCSLNPWNAMQFHKKNLKALEKIHEKIYPDKGSRLRVYDLQGHFAENFIVDDPIDFGDDGAIAKLYEEMEDEIAELKNEMSGDSTNPAAQALVSQLRARQGVELLKVPTIVSMAQDALGEGRSVAIFVNFNATLDAVADRLQTSCVIRGDQSAKERQLAIDDFQSDKARIIVCNLAAGGVGVSLHDTKGGFPRTALISPSFDAKALVQALGRTHRAGGKSPTYQRILVANGTIEEAVAKAAKQKIIGQEILNNGAGNVSNSETQTSYYSNIERMPDNTQTQKPDHGSRDHAEFSPSQLKYFEISPRFIPRGGTSWAADRGTRIHEVLEIGDITLLQDEEERAIAEKCLNFVATLRGTVDGKQQEFNEVRFDINLGDESTFGTCDLAIICGKDGVLVDYKTGFGAVDDAEINTQAWAYTLGAFQKWPQLERVQFYFLMPVRDEVSHAQFLRSQVAEMRLRLSTIITRAKKARETGECNPMPGVCDYCGNQATCKPLADKALLLAKKAGVDGFEIPEGSESPKDLAKLLKLAPIMESWAEGVKKLALSRAMEEGLEIPGFRLTERKTPRTITSALGAYEAVKDTVQLTDFLAACSKVSVPDLEKFFAEGLPRGKKGAGKQELVNRLRDASVLKEEGVVHLLKAEKN